jgi:hypothetical protein
MLNNTNTAEAELMEFLRREEVEDTKARAKRAAGLRETVRKIILSTKKMPHSLEGIDTMLCSTMARSCKRGEPSLILYGDEFYAPWWSPCPLRERERVGCEIAEAVILSDLPIEEGYGIAYDALCDVARMFPGY